MRRRNPARPTLRVVEPMPTDPMAPPSNLGEAGQNLWRSIQTDYRVDDAPGRNMLFQICAAADIAEEQHDRGLLKDELQSRAFIVRGLQKLNLDVEPSRDRVGRPSGPSIRR